MPIWIYIVASIIKSAVVLLVLLTAVAYTVWLERKVVGHMQNRWGPTRVGPFGLLQPAADGIKFLFKEDLTPPHVYKPLYIAAPLIAEVLPGYTRVKAVFVVVVPIALTEELFPRWRDSPWLGKWATRAIALALLVGAFVAWFAWTQRARTRVFHLPEYAPPAWSAGLAAFGLALPWHG